MGVQLVRFISRINFSIYNNKYRVLTPYNSLIGLVLAALYNLNLIRFYSKYTLNSSANFALVFLTFSKGRALLKSIKNCSRKSNLQFLDYKELSRQLNKGRVFVVTTSRGVYTTASPEFYYHKVGGVCLAELFF